MNYSLNKRVGKVLGLFISTKISSTRIPQNLIELDENGVVGDKFYAKDLNRSILISSIDSYLLAKSQNINMEYGELGENIIIDYNPYNLATGIKIKIGKVILEISQHCTLCKSLTKIDTKLPKLLKDDRGVFAKVVKSGTISSSNIVYL